MTARVVGLDLSLTATGMAAVWMDQPGRLTFECTSITTKGRREDTLTQRYERLQSIADRVGFFAKQADLVVVEGPAITRQGGSNWDRAGLWWTVVSELLWRRQPVAIAPPTVVKKWAAGKGNADKAAVAVGVARLWDQFECESDNEADALALATMGAQKLGLPVPSRAHHADVLVKVAWPAGLQASEGSSVERAS